jgi:anti-anti-sigma regulatory factor
MRIEESRRDGCIVVGLHGRLALDQAPKVRGILLERLGERPLAVICDLSRLEAIEPACAGLFLSVANQDDSGWPGTGLLLSGASPAVAGILRSLRVQEFLPLCTDVEEAVLRAVDRPPYLHDQVQLPPTPEAAAVARLLVREVFDHWRLPDPAPAGARADDAGGLKLVERVTVVVSELVTNAAMHARTDLTVRVELHGGRLWVKVRDGMPRMLTLARRGDWIDGGRGLVLVDALSSSWGVSPDPDGGKVTWAAFSLS